MSFKQSLEVGKIGESYIAKWLQKRGFHVLPVYEKEISENKGPTLFMASGVQRIAPDMLVFKTDKTLWVEAKRKSSFTWHRNSKCWNTGIDLRHYKDYVKVQDEHAEWDMWLLFLHGDKEQARDTPDDMMSPSGLFGQTIKHLRNNVHHKSSRWGSSGMVYWDHDKLIKLAEYNDVVDGL